MASTGEFSPLPYTKTPEFPTPRHTGCLGRHHGRHRVGGTSRSLQRFVERGGLLVTLGNGSSLALDGGLVRGVSRASGAGSVWTPGVELPDEVPASSIIPSRMAIRRSGSAFRGSFPVYATRPADRRVGGDPVGHEAPQGRPGTRRTRRPSPPSGGGRLVVESGGAKGEDVLEGRPAILDIPVAKGRVIA